MLANKACIFTTGCNGKYWAVVKRSFQDTLNPLVKSCTHFHFQCSFFLNERSPKFMSNKIDPWISRFIFSEFDKHTSIWKSSIEITTPRPIIGYPPIFRILLTPLTSRHLSLSLIVPKHYFNLYKTMLWPSGEDYRGVIFT